MQIHLYSKNASLLYRNLQEIVERSGVKTRIHRIRSLAHLIQRLSLPLNFGSDDITILMPEDRRELENLLTIRHLLGDTRIILVAPDVCEETIARAHLLHPRFLSFVSGDYSNIAAVVSKMLSNTRRAGGIRPHAS
jgi:hypothetical protein